jgi:hypothetical protein
VAVREGILPYHSRFIPAFSLRRNDLVIAVLESHVADRAMRADSPDRITVKPTLSPAALPTRRVALFRQVIAARIPLKQW